MLASETILTTSAQDPKFFTPVGDRYLVEVIEVESKTSHGILVPATASTEEETGWVPVRVVAKGNGHRLEMDHVVPMFYEIGTLACLIKNAGQKVRFGGNEYRVVSQVDLLGKFGLKAV